MYKIKWLSAVFCVLMLIGCGPQFRTDYTYIPPETESGQRCILKCHSERKKCEHRQRTFIQDCEYQQRKIALEKYRNYIEKQRVNGEEIDKNEDYFYDDWACRSNYDCDVEYRSCYKMCGGRVLEDTYCVKNCDKQ